MKREYQDYCVGCGLCASLHRAELKENARGYLYPKTGDESFLEKVCPIAGNHLEKMEDKTVWGKVKEACLGWSSDEKTRHEASSGGVITEICSYLLESNTVDAVIQTCVSDTDCTKTEIRINTTVKQVRLCCGSRYSISHPLEIIGNLDTTKRYAFVGKPCDIVVLRNYCEMDQEMKEAILYLFAFFCAGLPSSDAQKELLKELGCNKNETVSLQYRGNGWPGETTAVDTKGEKFRIDYETAWGKILGRDIMRMCRVCIDGSGELADIACGDAWYLTSEGKPDFSEQKGRNIVFVRTQKGMELWKKIQDSGRIECQILRDYEKTVSKMQPYQYKRKVTMIDKILALRFLKQQHPKYSWKKMFGYAKKGKVRTHWDIYKGTIRRIKENHF